MVGKGPIVSIQHIQLALICFCLAGSCDSSRLQQLKTVESYLNICLMGMHHKSKPTEEKGLTRQFCSPWASRSCCTEETALDISHDATWLNFDWNHCETLSPPCREYFVMDSCFYSCSPNVGPWLVPDERRIRKERFTGVPLCKSVCDRWWEACKNDFTCTDNWAANFNWSTGINTCPDGSTCRKFSEIFKGGSNHFCENVFGSFKVVPDSPPDEEPNCFILWPDPKYNNPNEVVARRRAAQILNVEYSIEGGASKQTDHNGSNKPISSILVAWYFVIFVGMQFVN